MLIQVSLCFGVLCWLIASVLLAAMFGAMFVPDKENLISRSIISFLILIPTIVLVPLSFAACLLLCVIGIILVLTIYGIRVALELIIDGIPEVDDDGNIVEPPGASTAPWV
tara:strand:- start:345 stop:677 length:333 start_codon:yes stop_codon:yes gene_type:complete